MMAVAAVVLKIPPFWPSDPQVWFAQVEAQFNTRGITVQKTKFEHIIASLAPEVAQEVRDIILDPPDANPYDTLKDQLIKRTAASEQRRLQQLFNAEELGDRKPTQLLRRMQQLLGDKAGATDASFIRELFLQRLPANVRMVLASSDTADINNLAQLADKVMEVAGTQHISNISHPAATEVKQLRSEIADLKRMFNSVTFTPQKSPRHPHRRPPSRNRSPSPLPPPPPTDICWYHQRFGSSARKCQSPCTMSGNDQASH
jgi:hypothetical protein